MFGMMEWAMNCPYYICTVTCWSEDWVFYKVNKEDLLKRVDPDNIYKQTPVGPSLISNIINLFSLYDYYLH